MKTSDVANKIHNHLRRRQNKEITAGELAQIISVEEIQASVLLYQLTQDYPDNFEAICIQTSIVKGTLVFHAIGVEYTAPCG